jgi:hypothetical protein
MIIARAQWIAEGVAVVAADYHPRYMRPQEAYEGDDAKEGNHYS